jgi:hypothetical protein
MPVCASPRLRQATVQRLDPERALVAALLRQALADLHDPGEAVRRDARAWFARGEHRYWLHLVGLPESSLDHALKETCHA